MSITVTVGCRNCGEEFEADVYVDPADPSVGVFGNSYSWDEAELKCPACGTEPPDDLAAELGEAELHDRFERDDEARAEAKWDRYHDGDD